jgi:RNA polymerase sigma factor (sigma-70 family)
MVSMKPAMQTDPASTATLIALARAGNAEGIAGLYRAHGSALLALAHSLTGSREDAEDVVHDVFLGLPEALRHYEERGSAEGWLKRVTARVALSRVRSRRKGEVELDSVEDVLASPSESHSAMGTALPRAIAALPPSLRQVFLLKEVDGYSHADIASFLGITVAASQVRLHRAIKLLRSHLAPTA